MRDQQFILNLNHDLFSISWIFFTIQFHFHLDNTGFKEFKIGQPIVFESFFSLKKFKILKNCFKLLKICKALTSKVLAEIKCLMLFNFRGSLIECEIFKEYIFQNLQQCYYLISLIYSEFAIFDYSKVIHP